ncbi:uncharacterized protein EV420DRAFT_1649069 [Desarmillaria tabescens]|uniref:Uncharacterized protein n=1 Tax=Armillaria tabescens TaxID=1929756 RepID=A0AA39JJT8_ARMTA|nr:uncharacterized protein EV420DRAFT_1649069 [Desarmillaria tabescens]KAK0443963.1 hypothetical protein EV420DRAFT_1649069 [Desarmillaria tabescens]
MARRSAPPNSGPAYIPKNQHVQRRAIHDPNESAFARFLREEIYAPEKLPGNISIVVGVSTFIVHAKGVEPAKDYRKRTEAPQSSVTGYL